MGHTAAEGNGMGRNKGLPKQLTEKQELLRQQSVNKVLRAIGELKAEGRSVTITAVEDIPSYAG